MKKIVLSAAAILFCCILNVSCNNSPLCGVNIDPAATPVCFIVKDVDGNNLLDPEFEGNILGNRIEVTHNQGKYPLILSEYAYGEHGLHTGGIGDDETPGILFWFFYIGKDSGGDEFTIDWGDGTSGFVKFDYYYTLDFFCNITNHENIYYNGEAKSNNSLIISLVK